MCAGRFLVVIFVLTLLVVAGAFLIFQFGGDVLRRQMTPQGHFEPPPPGSDPDYAQVETWIAHPAIHNRANPSEWLPSGSQPRRRGEPAAAFYIHPTTYLQVDRWNAPIDEAASRATAELFVRSQASVFNAVAEIWAPRYRQAAYGAFLLNSEDAHKAVDLAYDDIARAFDRFVASISPDRPIILAGHSQGALHLSRLLAERGPQIRRRLIAAYVVGWPVSVTADLPAMGLAPCVAPDQARCVLSWQSFREPANANLILRAWEGTRGLAGLERRREDMLCINPITGTQNGAAPPALNPGTLVPTADMSDARLIPGVVGGHCDKGLLMIEGAIPPLGPFVLPGNNYHVYDYALFWGALRRDSERRTAAWNRSSP